MNKSITHDSTNYKFHFFSGSLAEKEIKEIIKTQEEARKKILDFLGVNINRKIDYFLYPTDQIKFDCMGDEGNGNAIPDKFEVHAVYNEKVKCIGAHEDTHLFTIDFGLPPQLFREGLSEYMSGAWHNKTHNEWVLSFIKDNRLPDLEKLFDDDYWYEIDDRISYPVAGSFIQFLVTKLSKEKFLELYRSLNRDFALEKNIGILINLTQNNIGILQTEWKSSLEN